jgi:hypothetical protein
MANARWERGQLVEFDGLLAVVVATDADRWVPEDHVALWFGEPQAIRKSQGGPGGLQPEVWTVPADYCAPAADPVVRH